MIPDKKGFFVVASLHDLFDIFGAIATMVAVVVAIFALTSWQSQFRHAEKYSAVKALQEAANDIYKMRSYMFKLQEKYLWLLESGGVPDEAIDAQENAERVEWFSIQDRYTKAWAAAVIFLTDAERESVPISGKILRAMSFDLPMQLTFLYANSLGTNGRNGFAWAARNVIDTYSYQATETVNAVELIFSRTK